MRWHTQWNWTDLIGQKQFYDEGNESKLLIILGSASGAHRIGVAMSETVGILGGLDGGANSHPTSPVSLHRKISESSDDQDVKAGGDGDEDEAEEPKDEDEDEVEVPPSLLSKKQQVHCWKKNECKAEGAPSTEILMEANVVKQAR
jgi:hypothetical protein